MSRAALHHGDVGTGLPQRGADVVRGVVRPDHDGLLALVLIGARVSRGVMLVAAELLAARDLRDAGQAGRPQRQHQLPGPERDLLARAVDDDSPSVALPDSGLAGGRGPVVELHDLRVHLEPVADLVLRREHGPARRERKVGQVVVPDRVVQRERLVAPAPRVTRPLVSLDDDRRDPELAQPCAEGDAALATADDQYLRLHGVTELGGLTDSALGPRDPVTEGAVTHAAWPPSVDRLLVALQLVERREERERLARDEPQQPAAPPVVGLEGDPGGDDAVCFGRLLGHPEADGIDLVEARPGADRRRPRAPRRW